MDKRMLNGNRLVVTVHPLDYLTIAENVHLFMKPRKGRVQLIIKAPEDVGIEHFKERDHGPDHGIRTGTRS